MKRYESYKDSGIGWIGEIPSHWGVEPFGRHFSYGKGLPITKADLLPEGVAVISYGQIHSKSNTGTTITEDLVRYVSPEYLNSNPQALLKTNDFIFADTSEDIEGSGNCAFNDYGEDIFAGYHTVVARPLDLQYPRYYAYLFQSRNWKNQVQSLVNGVKVYSINKGILKKSALLFPSLSEQKAIVAFLDDKTARIDDLVAQVEREIELLKEYKQAEIARVVTKGLNPNAPMKPSGISWIGDIPQHWEILRNKNLFTSHYEPVENRKDIPLLSLTIDGVILRDVQSGKGKFPKDFEKYNVVYPNQIIFCLFDIDETPRTVGLNHNYGMITNAYDTFKINESIVLPRFITNYYLAVDNIKALRPYYTGLRKVVQYGKFMQLKVPIPPINEQQEIVDYIDRKTAEIDCLVMELTNQVDHLKEYKQRLIADVVTGKINVLNN